MWSEIKKIMGDKKSNADKIDKIKIKDISLENKQEIVNEFNKYFVNSIKTIVNDISETIENEQGLNEYFTNHYNNVNNCINDENGNSFLCEFDLVSYAEAKSIIKNLDNNKGSKLEINVKIIKLIWESNPNIILEVVNQSLKLGIMPNVWKLSTITPLRKIKNSENIEDFRPINTLPILEQILEQVVKNRLEKYLELKHILNDEQFGFRKYFSCETAIQASLTDWRKCLDKGMFIGVLFIDFARAFETISIKVLIKKLKTIGIGGLILKWFVSYLSNRRQRVKLDNIFSDEIRNENGVPQGSKLGQLLFLIYVNDMIKLINNLGVTCRLFADDTKIYFASDDLEEIENTLNLSLSILYKWLLKNQMKINIKKTVFM
ncbi:GSCOCG00011604001-RA-CDS, partial [Cotesia congregata]